MYGYYYLLLNDGGFVCYDQINENEVVIYSTDIDNASSFDDLNQAREYAKAINNNTSGKISVLTSKKSY